MANPEHLKILDQGVEVWNKWREDKPDITPDLSGANLSGADISDRRNFTKLMIPWPEQIRLIIKKAKQRDSRVSLYNRKFKTAREHGINLTNTDLQEANLSEAILIGANFTSAILREANLEEAILPWSSLTNARLMGATFNNAILSYSHLYKTWLFEIEFNNAVLRYANFEGSTLSEVQLEGANLTRAMFPFCQIDNTNFTEARIRAVNFQAACLRNVDFTRAKITRCQVYGIATWDLNTDQAIQADLDIVYGLSDPITVDNIELAQFIYLILKSPKIRDVIDTITSKVVLILGRFNPERKRILDSIREELRKRNYVPVMFDFERPASRDFIETASTLAHLAKFTIVDLTAPRSVQHELADIVPHLAIPVKPLLLAGKRSIWGTASSLWKYPWMMDITRYKDISDLMGKFTTEVIDPSEAKAAELIATKGRPRF
jgi:uncharacterized protein YjbI with pentapeptide repeats